jgi:ribosomal protein S27E
MTRKKDEMYKEPDFYDVIKELPDDETFVIGQSYEEYAATTLACKKCGNTAFRVGQGSYFTAIKCTECDWQLCIHEG